MQLYTIYILSSLTSRQILQISIYVDINDMSKVSFGKRTTVYPGTASFQTLLEDEIMNHRGESPSRRGSNPLAIGRSCEEQKIGHGFHSDELKPRNASQDEFTQPSPLTVHHPGVSLRTNDFHQGGSSDIVNDSVWNNNPCRSDQKVVNLGGQESGDDRKCDLDQSWQGKMLVSGKCSHPLCLARLKEVQSIRICRYSRFSANACATASGRKSGTCRGGFPALQKIANPSQIYKCQWA